MRFIDLFAGVGGFRLGMERAGHECIWSCEIDKWAKAVYRYRFGETPTGDARRVDPSEIPDFDLLCAGFPCQSFSLAGKRGGFEDARGTLFYEICRIARAKRPPLLLLENVGGLLSADNRLAFKVVLESLGELGYDVEWQVLNSKDFGVPQNRPRVFIVGHLGGLRGREVFPIAEVGGNGDERDKETAGGQIANTLSEESAGGQNARGNYMIEQVPIRFLNRNQRNFSLNTAMTVDTVGLTGVAIFDENIDGKVYERDICPALRSPNTIWNKKLLAGARIRRLTPRECERLQGFPDDFTKYGIDEKGTKVEISDTQRYKMMGNAVTVNVVEFLARRLPNG